MADTFTSAGSLRVLPGTEDLQELGSTGSLAVPPGMQELGNTGSLRVPPSMQELGGTGGLRVPPSMQNPGKAMRDRENLKELGVTIPEPLEPGASEEAETRANQKRVNDTVAGKPVTQGTLQAHPFMSGDPSLVSSLVAVEDRANELSASREDDDQPPGFFEGADVGAAWDRGWGQTATGVDIFNAMRMPPSSEREGLLTSLFARLKEDDAGGAEDSGFGASVLNATSETVAAMAALLTRPESAEILSTAVGLGGLAGLVTGGPLAPVTAGAGMAAGLGVGVSAALASGSFQSSAGLYYAEAREAGLEDNEAAVGAYVVGALNAGLETVGGVAMASPAGQAMRQKFQTAVSVFTKSGGFKRLVSNFAKDMAGGVSAEVATEVAAEAVTIATLEISKGLSSEDLESLSAEDIANRLSGAAEQAGYAAIGLTGASAGVRAGSDALAERRQKKLQEASAVAASRRAEQNSNVLGTAVEEMRASEVYKKAPDVAVDHASAAVKNSTGATDFGFPAADISALIVDSPEGMDVLGALGVSEDDLKAADATGGDVQVPVATVMDVLASDTLSDDTREAVKNLIRVAPDDMTAEEGRVVREFFSAEEATPEETAPEETAPEEAAPEEAAPEEAAPEEAAPEEAAPEEAAPEEAAPKPAKAKTKKETPELAKADEGAAGLRTILNDARQLGMSETEAREYLAARQNAADAAQARKAKREAREAELAKVKEEYAEDIKLAEAKAREEISETPEYAAFLSVTENGGLDRLSTEEADPGLYKRLKGVKSLDGSPVFAGRDVEGLDPSELAEMHGYPSVTDLLQALVDARKLDDQAGARAIAIARKTNPDLDKRWKAVQLRLKDFLTDENARVLDLELAAMQKAAKERRISAAIITMAAKSQIRKTPISEISARKLLQSHVRHENKARGLLKKGDIRGAARAKLAGRKAFEAAKTAETLGKTIIKRKDYLKKFTNKKKTKTAFKGIPPGTFSHIQQTLDGLDFGAKPSLAWEKKQRAKEKELKKKGIEFDAESVISARKRAVNWRDMSYENLELLYAVVKEIETAGKAELKLRRDEERATAEKSVEAVVDTINGNFPGGQTALSETPSQRTMANAKEAGATMLTPNTMAFLLDGGEELGPVRQNIVTPVQKAVHEGYREGQKGFIARSDEVTEKLVSIYDKFFSAKEKAQMNRPYNVPGLSRQITRAGFLQALMNMGTTRNMDALVNTFGATAETDIAAIRQKATLQDWDYVQEVWDYLDSFWDEVVATTERRHNFTPEKEEAIEFTVRRGGEEPKRYRGGYVPLVYDSEKVTDGQVANAGRDAEKSSPIDEAEKKARSGAAVRSHTRHGFTEARVDGVNKALVLDGSVIPNHLNQLVLDLEMGDALNDVWRVFDDARVKAAFNNAGQQHLRENLGLWLQDLFVGEMAGHGAVSAAARYARAGAVTSSIGWNLGTIMVQPLGLIQSSVVVGPTNLAFSLLQFMTPPFNSSAKVQGMSAFMRQRKSTFDKDVAFAQRKLDKFSLEDLAVSRISGEKSAEAVKKFSEFVRLSLFWGIKAIQFKVDTVTFMAGYRAGMKKFNGDRVRAQQFAEDAVRDSQGSGAISDRSAVERGTISRGTRQSDIVKLGTAFMTYFVAKNNIVVRGISKARRSGNVKTAKGAKQLAETAVNLLQLLVLEALVYDLLTGRGDPEEEGWGSYVLGAIASQVTAGIPVIRDVSSALQGFGAGGPVGSVYEKIGRGMIGVFTEEEPEDAIGGAVEAGLLAAGVPVNPAKKAAAALDQDDPWDALGVLFFGEQFAE